MPPFPPGRPGSLTPDQEAKLRELWLATLRVFGVWAPPPPSESANGSATPTPAPSVANSDAGGSDTTTKKKKGGRLGLFRSRHGDKDSSEATASEAGSGTATPTSTAGAGVAPAELAIDEDDKHGLGKAFKAALADEPPARLRDAFWAMVKHDHPDGLLLRFLRARKWDVNAALVMMVSTMHWRATEMRVDEDVMRKGEQGALEDATKATTPQLKKEGEDFMAQVRMGKSFLHGVDKEGRPLCHVRVRLHRQGEQSESSLERYTVYTIETARMLLRPPVDTATIIFDMTNFSMANMDYTPVKFMIRCFEANYPESLGAVIVYKSPWIFQGIWNIIRGWLDPVVASKVHFARTVDELSEFIPRSHIIAELGGDEDWAYEYTEPGPDENAPMRDGGARRDELLAERADIVARYEAALLAWIKRGQTPAADEKAPVAPADEAARGLRDALASELRENYWRLDPYVRARSLYDRTGMIGQRGELRFYGDGKAGGSSQAGRKESGGGAEDDLD
ncbi:CRAL-TRIO domain-containing protein [Lineolata rhizophorae]|uniref:CRAL-TRIO domain-containing protein n=1 Tax=Lineolata rhizophorae TaxID=578093 RepID=A0A6A6P744_9PEZI|nr:CRAL-TRIO domain-containing protein [Lineolata rhizophorae]